MAMVAAALLVLLMASGSLALQLPGVLVIQGVHVLLEDVVVAKGAMAEVLEKALSPVHLPVFLCEWW